MNVIVFAILSHKLSLIDAWLGAQCSFDFRRAFVFRGLTEPGVIVDCLCLLTHNFVSVSDEWSAQSVLQPSHEYPSTMAPHQLYSINQHTLLVLMNDNFQTVYFSNGKLRCDCQSHHGFCSYVQIIHQLLKNPTSEDIVLLADFMKQPVATTDSYQQTSVSSHLIEFCG